MWGGESGGGGQGMLQSEDVMKAAMAGMQKQQAVFSKL